MCSPFHSEKSYIKKYLLELLEQGYSLIISLPGLFPPFFLSRYSKFKNEVWFLAPANAPKVVDTCPIKSSLWPSSSSNTSNLIYCLA